jgi:hypothetical protein
VTLDDAEEQGYHDAKIGARVRPWVTMPTSPPAPALADQQLRDAYWRGYNRARDER